MLDDQSAHKAPVKRNLYGSGKDFEENCDVASAKVGKHVKVRIYDYLRMCISWLLKKRGNKHGRTSGGPSEIHF